MLSSLGGEEDIVRQAPSKGATAYLIKSDFAPEQLQQEVRNASASSSRTAWAVRRRAYGRHAVYYT
jgi:hypothetical protein